MQQMVPIARCLLDGLNINFALWCGARAVEQLNGLLLTEATALPLQIPQLELLRQRVEVAQDIGGRVVDEQTAARRLVTFVL